MASSPITPEWLNYHHLRHFWMIAQHRSMTRAAEALRVSQSTLSEQLRELEESLGQPLFERRGRQLLLTDAGLFAQQHAETIFATGRELLARFRQSGPSRTRVLRIGAVEALSKNLQFDFIQPLLADEHISLVVVAGTLDALTRQLEEHTLDLVLSHIPVRSDKRTHVFNHPLGEVPVYLVGSVPKPKPQAKFPHYLRGQPLFLPSHRSPVRGDFDALLAAARIEPVVRAEVDDMALMRLLALSGKGLALVSKIVVERELQSRQIKFMARVPGLAEKYFALTVRKRFENAWTGEIVDAFRARLKELAANPAPRQRSHLRSRGGRVE